MDKLYKNIPKSVLKLEYIYHADNMIGSDTVRTILFATSNELFNVKNIKGLESKMLDWLELMLPDAILLKMIVKNNNSVTFLLRSYDNRFSDITEKNISEVNKIDLNQVNHKFALELFTHHLLLLN